MNYSLTYVFTALLDESPSDLVHLTPSTLLKNASFLFQADVASIRKAAELFAVRDQDDEPEDKANGSASATSKIMDTEASDLGDAPSETIKVRPKDRNSWCVLLCAHGLKHP